MKTRAVSGAEIRRERDVAVVRRPVSGMSNVPVSYRTPGRRTRRTHVEGCGEPVTGESDAGGTSPGDGRSRGATVVKSETWTDRHPCPYTCSSRSTGAAAAVLTPATAASHRSPPATRRPTPVLPSGTARLVNHLSPSEPPRWRLRPRPLDTGTPPVWGVASTLDRRFCAEIYDFSRRVFTESQRPSNRALPGPFSTNDCMPIVAVLGGEQRRELLPLDLQTRCRGRPRARGRCLLGRAQGVRRGAGELPRPRHRLGVHLVGRARPGRPARSRAPRRPSRTGR